MKLKIFSLIICLLPIPATYADARVIDSPQVCEKRINSYKSALKAAIKAKQNVDVAQEQLNQINKLPSTLSPCEKQRQIPALSNSDKSSVPANEALKDREISP